MMKGLKIRNLKSESKKTRVNNSNDNWPPGGWFVLTFNIGIEFTFLFSFFFPIFYFEFSY